MVDRTKSEFPGIERTSAKTLYSTVFETIASTVSRRGGDVTGQRSVLPPVQSTTRLVHAAEQEEHEATSQGTSGRVPVAITTTVNNKRNEKAQETEQLSQAK